MTAEVAGSGSGALPLPTPDDHVRPEDPVARCMTASGQLADLLLFLLIKR
jgi:hypothetical protein